MHLGLLARTSNSHFGCACQAILAPRAHGAPHQIRILAAYPKRFLNIWRLALTSNSHFRCVCQAILAYMALGGHIKFAFSLCISSDSYIHGASLAGTSNSHFRCASQANLEYLAIGEHITFAFSLRIPSDSCIHGAWRARQIRSFAVYPKRFLHIWRLAGTSNSKFRCVAQAILAFQDPCWHIKLASSLCIPSDSGMFDLLAGVL